MSSPKHSLFWMAVYLAIVAGVCALLFVPLRDAFMANWGFNSLILAVLAVGLVINIRQVVVLGPEITWIKLFRTGETGISVAQEPRLLKPLARHLHGRRRDRFRLSALALRTVLDGIRARLDESREISRYIIGLLIFLGLLGTFWGLLGTIGAVGRVIAGLDVSGGDAELVFRELRAGLEAPLAGMGTAFSSSLFGLGGSLVLGFLDLQASHAQNRFFNGLEEWLTGVTQLIDEPGRARLPEHPPVEIEEAGALTPLLEELRAQRRLLEGLLGGSVPAERGGPAAASDPGEGR
jgi:hypothetical protein